MKKFVYEKRKQGIEASKRLHGQQKDGIELKRGQNYARNSLLDLRKRVEKREKKMHYQMMKNYHYIVWNAAQQK